ncbi:MAG: hypothetical protein J0L58_07420 [Burkholderiales bacterium]|uniref:hypothetical protein n=1 Tax=Inhella sp. TaxID=1921806 RepID=UPI001ACA77E6|nr:hypothetical protein [Burkholderiales bacterium]
MNWPADLWEQASYIVTVIGLPFAIWVFLKQERAERENEEEEAYLLLADAYDEFLKVVLAHSDLQLRTQTALENPTPEQRERMQVIFEMLISLFERAYLVAWKPEMSESEKRRWNSWDDAMREWCARDDFFFLLPQLLRGEDAAFAAHLQQVAKEVRGTGLVLNA